MKAVERDQIYNKLKELNQAYILVFTDYNNRSELISRKATASLINQVYGLLQQGSTQERNQTKEVFITMFRQFVSSFIENYILANLGKCNEYELINQLLERWSNFKKFTFLYFTLFQYAHNHYQSAYKSYESQGLVNRLQNQNSIFPVACLALYYFYTAVYIKYKGNIHRQIRKLLSQERSEMNIGQLQRQRVKNLLQIIYSCGLRQLARIGSTRGINNQIQFQFYVVRNAQLTKNFTTDQRNPEEFIFSQILNNITLDLENYYNELFLKKLSILSPIEDFNKVSELLSQQQQRSQFYFFTSLQKKAYLRKVKDCLILTNFEERLRRETSFRFYLEQFSYQSDEYLSQIRVFIHTALKSKAQTLNTIEKIVEEYLIESGNRINQKINKRRGIFYSDIIEYINEMIVLKKSINIAIQEAMDKQLGIYIVRDRCFRKMLDSIQASRNLADFADFRIKECIKTKLSDEQAYEKIKDIFLILQNIAATDSFLIYHQEMLAKRLIDPLNEPKVETQIVFLKKLAEKLGTVSVSSHFNMIKDIENSQQMTEKFNKQLPFCNFRWGCRIISQPFWPDSINKVKIQIQMPQILRLHAETVSGLFHEAYQYRYLKWKSDKGFSLFEGKFESGKYRFQSQNIFMVLLLHISESRFKQILFGNLKRKVRMQKQKDNEYLMKCIGVLIQNNLVLRDQNQSNSPLSDGQLLRVNLKYAPKQATKPNQIIMIKVSQDLQKAMHMTTVEHSKIMRQREKIVEAVLVKLLKHSHSTGTNSLTFQQLYKGIKEHHHLGNFNFSEAVVKQRLQELIHRGYCERDENDRKIYHYIA